MPEDRRDDLATVQPKLILKPSPYDNLGQLEINLKRVFSFFIILEDDDFLQGVKKTGRSLWKGSGGDQKIGCRTDNRTDLRRYQLVLIN